MVGWILLMGAACEPMEVQEDWTGRVLRVGYSEEPPFSYLDGSGRVTGEGPELFRRVAEALGITELIWVRTDFSSLLPALGAGRVDAIAAGLFITPERAALVRFTSPTFCVAPAVATRIDTDVGVLERFEELAQWEVAAIAGGVESTALLPLLAERGGSLLAVPDLATGLAALREGRVDALVTSIPTARHLASIDESLSASDPLVAHAEQATLLTGCGAPAFRPEDEALARSWDQVLANFLGSEEHLDLITPFGFSPDNLPRGGRRDSGSSGEGGG